jgi:hypothetical protein
MIKFGCIQMLMLQIEHEIIVEGAKRVLEELAREQL